jgi:hypothetical protein
VLYLLAVCLHVLQAPLNKLQDQTCKRVLHAVRHNRLVAEVSWQQQPQHAAIVGGMLWDASSNSISSSAAGQ